MMKSQLLSIALLAYGTSNHAVARTSPQVLTLADVQDKAQAALAAAHAQPHSRHLRSLQSSFDEVCSSVKDTFQQSGFNCTCSTNTLTCQLPSYCTDDADAAVCADFEMSITYNSDMTSGSVSVCVKYSNDPTGDNRDVCVSMSFGSDFTSISSCSVQIEDSSGTMTTCNTCEPCSDGMSLNIDCTNVIPDATTNGCSPFALTGGDSTQNTLQNLGSSAGNSTTSNGGGGIVSGNSTTGTGGGGTGNGGSGSAGSGSGSGTGGSTSSGVSHGAGALVMLSGVALALIM